MTTLPLAGAPPVHAGYPRPIRSIHQVEITSHCNLRCVYCPSRNLDKPHELGPDGFPTGFGRAKEDMTLETFEKALRWATHFQHEGGTQGELSLTGIGETLLHPQWREIVSMARAALPENFICFSTNGILLDDAACAHLASERVGVYISLHRPEKAGKAIEHAKRHGILMDVNASAATSAFDWAGQLDWYVSTDRYPCEYLRSGWAVVLADGRITTCCLDASGAGVVGTVDDEPGSLSIAPFSLCGPCHMDIVDPVEPGDQRGGAPVGS